MNGPAEDFATVFARAKNGCPEALGELFTRYSPRVQAVVHRRLMQRLRTQLDSTDCTQDVWLSFLKVSLARLEFPDEKAFLGYLTRIAVNKLGEEHRRRTTQKNDLDREEAPLATEPAARQATASQQAVAQERWEQLAADLTPPQRQMLEMLRAGCTHDEIGERLGIHPKTVQRLLQRLKPRTGS
jgi:RNA polymerase sigma factor (sigma-70 family)